MAAHTFHHTGSMPCPICHVVDPHVHTDVTADDVQAAVLRLGNGSTQVGGFYMSAMATQVLAERQRQIDVEGFSVESDHTAYPRGELVKAAICYALYAFAGARGATGRPLLEPDEACEVRRLWPWTWSWFKPDTRRRALVKAAALLIAEGDRLDRATDTATAKLENP